jgi:hypothetical protein
VASTPLSTSFRFCGNGAVFPGEITMRRRPEWILNRCRWILYGPDLRVWGHGERRTVVAPFRRRRHVNPDHRHRKGAFVHSRPAPPALPSRPRCSKVMLLLLAGCLSWHTNIVKVGERFSTQDTLGGAIAAALCAAGSQHVNETDRAGSGMVYRSAHAAVDPSVAVDVFAADPTENRPVFVPRATSTARSALRH